jgi:hypothetical protein
VVAHRIGEPFGTLVLALAVTVIEVALIVSVMLSGGEAKAALARDTVFAAIMIVCNGIVGLCLLLGGLRHREQEFKLEGVSVALAVLGALAILSLVLPNFAVTAPGPVWSTSQLAFAGVAALLLYGSFVFVQTVRHRDYFLPVGSEDESAHADHRPRSRPDQPRSAPGLAGRGGGAGQGPLAVDRGWVAPGRPQWWWGSSLPRWCCSLRAWLPPSRGAQPSADQPQPRPRLGPGKHRADHPGGRGLPSPGPVLVLGLGPLRRCCWS